MIIKPDKYIPFYALEKQKDPKKKLWWLQVRRQDIDDVDNLVELAHGSRESIRSEQDWVVFDNLLKFYIMRWPREFEEFRKTVPQIRATRRSKGYSASKEMMYLASLPPRLERLIKIIFPLQKFNKDFIYKLIRKYKIFRIGGEK